LLFRRINPLFLKPFDFGLQQITKIQNLKSKIQNRFGPISVEQWRELQMLLIEVMGA
jgi:hypothetical protein